MRMALREKISNDVFDYLQLTAALSEYGNVRAKIGRLLANGEIIRIKKGFYTFPEYMLRAPLNPCVVANMLYGPSYVSCDYALAYYGMIPERVEAIASMAHGRPRTFSTPVGVYKYYQRHSDDYSVGVLCQENPHANFLVASPTKAIYDKALTDQRYTGDGIEEYLLADLRLEEDCLNGLDNNVLAELSVLAVGRMKRLVEYLQGRVVK